MDAKFTELDSRMERLRAKLASFPASITADYRDRLDVSWLFHDNAMEGVVLSYSELKAAIDSRIISDVSLIPMYEEVRLHKQAVDWVRENAPIAEAKPIDSRRSGGSAEAKEAAREAAKEALKEARKHAVRLDFELVKKLYAILTPEAGEKGFPLRKENPLHRLYYHEIAAPEKIAPRIKKLDEWMESRDFSDAHPIVRAAKAHHDLLNIYPWTKNSGKVARLLMNFILIRAGYLPAVIHSIERQRYYESLRFENPMLLNLITESIDNGIETTSKFFAEIGGLRVRRAS
jgi:Fic/DOC family